MPVIALTGWNISEEDVAGTGLRLLIRKPFDLGDLQESLEGCLAATVSAEQRRQEAIARQFCEQLAAGDVASALSLCTDDLRVYSSRATKLAHRPAADPILGRAASRAYLRDLAAAYPQARLEAYVAFPQPEGLAMRYVLSWQAPDASAVRRQMSGAIIFAFRSGRISQVTLNDRERLATVVSQSMPAAIDTQDFQG